jgi:hypothetical protein
MSTLAHPKGQQAHARAPALFDRPLKKENEMDRYALERDGNNKQL